MKKMNKFFITTLVAGLVAFSAVLAVPTQLANALIGTNQIANDAITSPKIRDGEVRTSDVADNTVTTSKIPNGAVTKEKLNPNAVKLVVVQREQIGPDIPPHSVKEFHVDCGAQETATGGGFSGDTEVDGTVISSQRSGNGWSVVMGNFGDISDVQRPGALAECAHLELGP
jgi:hypothetical protein